LFKLEIVNEIKKVLQKDEFFQISEQESPRNIDKQVSC